MSSSASYVHGASDKQLIGQTIGRFFDEACARHAEREALVVRHLGLARPDDGIQRLVFAIMGIPVYLIMAQDLVQALSPNL